MAQDKRTKINKEFSSWQELMQGVPQEYVLGPLIFNIYLNDFFLLLNLLTYVILQTIQLFMYVIKMLIL